MDDSIIQTRSQEVPGTSTDLTCSNTDMEMPRNLDDLPDDVIFMILRLLDVKSLGRTARVSKRMRRLVSTDTVWREYSCSLTLVQEKNGVCCCRRDRKRRSSPKLRSDNCCLMRKCKLAGKWSSGLCWDRTLLTNSVKQIPWIQYDRDQLWVSTEQCISCYELRGTQKIRRLNDYRKSGPRKDITRFVIKDDLILCGCRDGSVWGWRKEKTLEEFTCTPHQGDVNCVDFHDSTVVSGSSDDTIKVLSIEGDGLKQKSSLPIKDKVWSVALSPDGSVCSCGTTGNVLDKVPLSVWDLNRASQICCLGEFKPKAGIYDIKFEDPHTLITAGYDTTARLWDLRTQSCVSVWMEPFDSSVYCIQTDGYNALFTGTARHGMIRFWDRRNTKTPVQMFYVDRRDSPVYSMDFESTRLYAALDLSIHMLDFT